MLPTGLDNFGNTCYMNATVQCLKAVPELREKLKRCECEECEGSGVCECEESGVCECEESGGV